MLLAGAIRIAEDIVDDVTPLYANAPGSWDPTKRDDASRLHAYYGWLGSGW